MSCMTVKDTHTNTHPLADNMGCQQTCELALKEAQNSVVPPILPIFMMSLPNEVFLCR